MDVPATTRVSAGAAQPCRLLICDITRIGDRSASGELKGNLLADWPAEALLEVYGLGRDAVGVAGILAGTPVDEAAVAPAHALSMIHSFRPECVLYRPVPDNPVLHDLVMQLIRRSTFPLVIWIMDDWPAVLATERPDSPLLADLEWLLGRSARRLAIGQSMVEAFRGRYGQDFVALANGVDPAEWSVSGSMPDDDRVARIRYAGALSDDMVLASVVRVARAVEGLAAAGRAVRMEIVSSEQWASAAEGFAGLRSVRLSFGQLSTADYRRFLQEATVNLIAYNFDERSRRYVSHSLANKLPECLVSGAALLVHGPSDVATVALVAGAIPGAVVARPDETMLRDWLVGLLDSAAERRENIASCRDLAIRSFSLDERRRLLRAVLAQAVAAPFAGDIRCCLRCEEAHLDEVELVSRLLADRVGPAHLMLDVGAHHGSSAEHFVSMGWTVHAFEPDPANRRLLVESLGGAERVTIDTRAVADRDGVELPWYRSDVSDGISGLLAFHDSHVEQEAVAVTSIASVSRERGFSRIDFLKIDVEGMDLSVLRGVPWDDLQPDVIVCEFEDAKTRNLGHVWNDIADYLCERAYVVFVSEWYPIRRYGERHQWRALRRYPCVLAAADGWGNLIAFRCAPSVKQIGSAVDSLLDTTTGFESGWRDRARRIYVRTSVKLRQMSPGAWHLARRVKRSLLG